MHINVFRKQKNVTVEEFASKLEISVSYTMLLCYGKKKISMNILKKIKEVYPETDLNIFFDTNYTECIEKSS